MLSQLLARLLVWLAIAPKVLCNKLPPKRSDLKKLSFVSSRTTTSQLVVTVVKWGSCGCLCFKLQVQLWSLLYRLGSGLLSCAFIRGPSCFLRKVLLMAMAELQEGKPKYASTFEASPCTTLGKISVVKASRMSKFNIRRAGKETPLYFPGWVEWIFAE